MPCNYVYWQKWDTASKQSLSELSQFAYIHSAHQYTWIKERRSRHKTCEQLRMTHSYNLDVKFTVFQAEIFAIKNATELNKTLEEKQEMGSSYNT